MHKLSFHARSVGLLGICWFLAAQGSIAAHAGPPVNAGKPSKQQLRAPDDRESFDFMIFGDRTGGPPEGIEVLKQGVEMANRLDVDLILTVGDLIQGYNQPDEWLPEMLEYKTVMAGGRMPWYPVAGNHDVYARPKRAGGHMALYSEHFGPLYYSFDYKWAHFVALFSDEALSFRNPSENQNFSAEQMSWLREDLAATEATQIFVFLHHPRWTKRYAGCNWNDVHGLFVSDGRPVTVFAGHMHVYRSDGWIDNVRYYGLATTGGRIGRYPETAALHHVNFVRVRPDRATVAVLPIGSVLSDDFVLGEELDTMYELSDGDWLDLRGHASVGLEEGKQSSFTVTLANPTDRTMRFSAELKTGYGWSIDCESIDRQVEPGESLEIEVQAVAPALDALGSSVVVRATAHYPLRSGLVQPIDLNITVPIKLLLPQDAGAANPEHNGVLVLDGSSAVRVDVPRALPQYTLECWARGGAPAGTTALLSKSGGSDYGVFWCTQWLGAELPTGYVCMTTGYLSLQSSKAWDWRDWTHLALVCDGKRAAFYVNGKLQAEKTTDAALTHNRRPLYIGADPDRNSKPTHFFTGEIDEVRLSKVVRYDRPFTPELGFQRDDKTILLLHFDQVMGGAHPDDSGTGHHGWGVGRPRIERAQRP